MVDSPQILHLFHRNLKNISRKGTINQLRFTESNVVQVKTQTPRVVIETVSGIIEGKKSKEFV